MDRPISQNSSVGILSVIVPVKRIDAVASQALIALAARIPRVEVVVVGHVANELDGLPKNLRMVSKECTLYAAMNIGAQTATSTYLLFMGIDDRFREENLSPVLDRLQRTPQSPLIALPVQIGRRVIRIRPRGGKRVAFHHQGLLFRRSSLIDAGGYADTYRLHGDLDLMIRLQRSGPAGWLDLPLVEFRTGGMSTSGVNARQSIREFSQIYRAHGLSRLDSGFLISVAYQIWFMIKRRTRRIFFRSSEN